MSNVLALVTIVHVECGACHLHFGLEQGFYNGRQADHRDFYCPNGCIVRYGAKSAAELRAERAEREAADAKRTVEWERERAEAARREANVQTHRARALKGHATRLKKRVACGVCPACRRSFENLRRHMSTQHPQYGKAGEVAP